MNMQIEHHTVTKLAAPIATRWLPVSSAPPESPQSFQPHLGVAGWGVAGPARSPPAIQGRPGSAGKPQMEAAQPPRAGPGHR